MPLTLLPNRSVTPLVRRRGPPRGASEAIVVVLVNDMPDSALDATAAQFSRLLRAAAGPHSVALRLSYLPDVPRNPEAMRHLERDYWPLAEVLEQPLDALIVTGLEPKAARLTDEPYWRRLAELVDWAHAHARSSIWSCLAAHAAVLRMDGIERHRLERKRFGVFEHPWVEPHPLMQGVEVPLATPHSRWNDLPVDALRASGYTILSSSPETGADIFVRERRGLHVFFQGHPEYEATTLLKEFRRDVGRYLRGEQSRCPQLPEGYFCASATAALRRFLERVDEAPSADLAQKFPIEAASAGLRAPWAPAAKTIYRNWLEWLAAARRAKSAPAAIGV
jgi:homoserine O-succinyltransferase/O-acetyltransferase